MVLKTSAWDPAEHLNTPEERAEYLNAALRDGDEAYFQHALGVIARAEGMSSIASSAGLNREHLYRSLSDGGNPRFQTVVKVLKSIGLDIDVRPSSQLSPTSR